MTSKNNIALLLLSIFATLILVQNSIHAQNIDSLVSVLPTKEGKDKIRLLSDLCYYLSFSDVENSEKYGKEALELATQLNDSLLMAGASSDLGILYMNQSEYKKGLERNLYAYEIRKKVGKPENQLGSLSKIGVCYRELGELDKGLDYILQAVRIIEENDLQAKFSTVYENLATTYGMLEKYDLAKETYRKAIKHGTEAGSIQTVYTSLNGEAGIHRTLGEIDSSIFKLNKILTILGEVLDKKNLANTYGNLATLYSKKGSLNKANSLTLKSIELYKEMESNDGIAIGFMNLADFIVENGQARPNKHSAIKYLEAANARLRDNPSIVRQAQYAEISSRFYEQIGDFKKALNYKNQYHTLNDSILNIEKNKTIETLEIQFQTEKKDKQLAEQQVEITVQEARVKQRNSQLLLASSLLLLLIIGGAFVYNYQKNKQTKLEQQVALEKAEAVNKMQSEKLRISRDLHDNIGSQLTFVISSLDNISYVKTEDQKQERLDQLATFTKDTLGQLRDTIWAIKNEEVDTEELFAKLSQFIQQAQRFCPHINFKTNFTKDNQKIFNSNEAINIFRVVQEALNNAIKYSDCTTIELTLDSIGTSVIDNGKGFDRNKIEEGNGLSNMEQRMKELGYKTEITSKIGEGSTVRVYFT